MTLGSAFLDRIEQPTKRSLQTLLDEAVDDTTVQLQKQGHSVTDHQIRKLSYVHYHDWERDDPTHVFLSTHPGTVTGAHSSVLADSGVPDEKSPPREWVRVDRRFGVNWLAVRNSGFSSEFFSTLDEAGLIDLGGSWEQYLDQKAFFDEFYLTPTIKYRSESVETSAYHDSFQEFVLDELCAIDPEWTFVFGRPAWNALRKELDPQPVRGSPDSPEKITECHAVPHRVTGPLETTIVPLCHVNNQSMKRSEYMDRLRSGLEPA